MQMAEELKCDWKKIARKFGNKKYTPHFLKITYKNLIDKPIQKRMLFSHKEDLIIAKHFNLIGTNWKKIATFLKNRTGVMVKNRYYSFLRKKNYLSDFLAKVKEIEKERPIEECDENAVEALANSNDISGEKLSFEDDVEEEEEEEIASPKSITNSQEQQPEVEKVQTE